MTYDQLVFEGRDNFEVTNVAKEGQHVFITVNNKCATCKCPQCGVESQKIHSTYQRKLMDLPILANQTWIKLCSRKFFCRNDQCERKVFTERFNDHFRSYHRRTTRLAERLIEVAHRSGGNSGERICRLLYMPVSSSTLIRTIHRQPVATIVTPKAVGIDDWAYTKRINYGTIVVDLEQRRIIDLLPDRETETVSKWLTEHPGIEVLTRDRFSNFANAVSQSSPGTIQVADRWHLLHNLTEAIEKMLRRNNHYLKDARDGQISKAQQKRDLRKKAQFEENSFMHKKFAAVKQELAKGRKIMHIHRELNVDRRTIYKWKKLDELPRRVLPVRTNIALYEPEIKKMLADEPGITIWAIWEKIKAMGYNGGQITAYRQIGRIAGKKANYIPQMASAFWQPSKASLMLCRLPEKLTDKEKEIIKCLCQRSKEVKQAAK